MSPGRLTHIYNFAAQDKSGFTSRELDDAVHYIYEREGQAFRLNAALGTLLQHRWPCVCVPRQCALIY